MAASKSRSRSGWGSGVRPRRVFTAALRPTSAASPRSALAPPAPPRSVRPDRGSDRSPPRRSGCGSTAAAAHHAAAATSHHHDRRTAPPPPPSPPAPPPPTNGSSRPSPPSRSSAASTSPARSPRARAQILLDLLVNGDGEGGGEFVQRRQPHQDRAGRATALLQRARPSSGPPMPRRRRRRRTAGSGSSSRPSTPRFTSFDQFLDRGRSRRRRPSRATRHRSPSAARPRSPATRSSSSRTRS